MDSLPKPYYQDDAVTIYHADCRDILPLLEPGSIDLVLTDPPYGVGKAEWDTEFNYLWMDDLGAHVRCLAVMPGVVNLPLMPFTVGYLTYRWTLSVLISNGMTRGAFGFGNWIPCMVYAEDGLSLMSRSQDATVVPVTGKKPEHPSPKPIKAIEWLLGRLPGETLIDPFFGSGTVALASKMLGRKCIGIEIEERYCEIAAKRMAQTVMDLAT